MSMVEGGLSVSVGICELLRAVSCVGWFVARALLSSAILLVRGRYCFGGLCGFGIWNAALEIRMGPLSTRGGG